MIGVADFCETITAVDDMTGHWVDVSLRLELMPFARISQRQVGELHLPEAITRTRRMLREAVVDHVYGDLVRQIATIERRIHESVDVTADYIEVANQATTGLKELREMIAACVQLEEP